jgi:hypothetical protein
MRGEGTVSDRGADVGCCAAVMAEPRTTNDTMVITRIRCIGIFPAVTVGGIYAGQKVNKCAGAAWVPISDRDYVSISNVICAKTVWHGDGPGAGHPSSSLMGVAKLWMAGVKPSHDAGELRFVHYAGSCNGQSRVDVR